ncbi:MAG TPA: VOC family protein [Pseudonocardiaceae bacterium]|jgi:hypothetical protein|nr:VOC family protein [Pseudonocardiaceae bacterium]
MPFAYQVTVDSTDPHTQAIWWAETMDWRVEPTQEDFIRRMIAEGQATESDTIVFRDQLWWREGAAIVHPDGADAGIGYRILFQSVPEPRTAKNRLHLDLRVPADQFETTVARLAERGATESYRRERGPFSWTTMTDPEGNEFCVTRAL